MKPFTLIAIVVFVLVALLQLIRFVLGWEVTVNHVAIPIWASGIAFLIAAALAFMLWRERQQ